MHLCVCIYIYTYMLHNSAFLPLSRRTGCGGKWRRWSNQGRSIRSGQSLPKPSATPRCLI